MPGLMLEWGSWCFFFFFLFPFKPKIRKEESPPPLQNPGRARIAYEQIATVSLADRAWIGGGVAGVGE